MKASTLLFVKSLYRRLPLPTRIRWVLKVVFFETFGRFMRSFGSYQFYLDEKNRKERQRREKPSFSLPALPEPCLPDVCLMGVIDWHFRIQRPQHLARGLAERGHRVFYFSPDFAESYPSGITVEPLDPALPLYNVFLPLKNRQCIYSDKMTDGVLEQLREGMAAFLAWTGANRRHVIVEHPYWFRLARLIPDSLLIYDCLDDHSGFPETAPHVVDTEKELFNEAHLVIVSSQVLHDTASRYGGSPVLIRNACDHDYFSAVPAQVLRDGKPVIGYIGAIAEHVDIDLIQELAGRFPHCSIWLVGADTAGASLSLSRHKNVHLFGEIRYEKLPQYLHSFDVCILPFKKTPLTQATNPVKLYEYLSAGKPVVSVDIPEAGLFVPHVRIASDKDGFIGQVAEALSEDSPDAQGARIEFASQQTWQRRVDDLIEAVGRIREPRVTIIVVTFNNLHLTRDCLESLVRFSDYDNYEVIVVDNCSEDGTREFLMSEYGDKEGWKIILNSTNRGFAAANNQGLKAATGDYLVLLNNDTVVTWGWLRTALGHFRRDRDIGILGPVTNNIGNEARVATSYKDIDGMHREASSLTARNMGKSFDIHTLGFFCAMFPRAVLDRVGLLDEAFGQGFFEDDDYCRRIEKAGYRVVCAEDVFVHHHLSSSFNRLSSQRRRELFERNRKIYEEKWGPWKPHRYRGSDG